MGNSIALDDHGCVLDDPVPGPVRGQAALKRFQRCLEVADEVTGRHAQAVEVSAFARALLDALERRSFRLPRA